MKRLLLFTSAICASTAGIAQRAEAQNYPLVRVLGDDGGGTNCGFMTFQQCQNTTD